MNEVGMRPLDGQSGESYQEYNSLISTNILQILMNLKKANSVNYLMTVSRSIHV